MEIMIQYKFHTGLFDEGTVKDGNTSKPAKKFSLLLQGQLHERITKQPETESGIPPFTGKNGSGLEYMYLAASTLGPRRILLPDTIISYEEDSEIRSAYTYNSLLQSSGITRKQYHLTPGTKKINLMQTVTQNTNYYWEQNPTGPGRFAPALIDTESEDISQTKNNASIQQYIYKKRYTYGMNVKETGENRFYYSSTEKGDGLDFHKWTYENKVTRLSDSTGRIAASEAMRPNAATPGEVTKYQYAANTNLVVAALEGMILTNDKKETAHYLHFENYVEEPNDIVISADHNMTSRYFLMNNVELADHCFLGSRCLRVTGNSNLKITDNFGIRIDPGRSYLFSCYRKENEDSPWKYFEKECPSNTLNQNKLVHIFIAGQQLCHIMLRETECNAQINVYDPETMLPFGTIDNFGVPTIYRYDKLNRLQLAYSGKISKSQASELYYDISGKAAIHSINFTGYSRFNGFNCSRETTAKTTAFNSGTTFMFPEEGVLLSRSGGKLGGLTTNTMFASGLWLTSEQTILIKKQTYTYKVTMANNTASLSLNNIVMQKSENYLADKSSWAVFVIGSYIGLIVNGKIILSYVHTVDSTITEILTGSSAAVDSTVSLFNDVLVTTKVLLETSYFDDCGNLLQSQLLRNGRALLRQTFYDRRGNAVLKTAPAYYPTEGKKLAKGDKPLAYRSDFAKMDFSAMETGGMTGEIIEFFNSPEGQKYCEAVNDKKWPYTKVTYEVSATNRMEATQFIGEYGRKQTDLSMYHGAETFFNFNDFSLDGSTNYSENLLHFTNTENQYEMKTNQLFCANNMRYAERMLGTAKIGTGALTSSKRTYISASGIINTSSHIAFYTSYYLNDNLSTTQMEEKIFAAGRKKVLSSPNSGIRTVYYDSIGNERLQKNSAKNRWLYAHYDVHGRILESGLLTPSATDLDETFEEKVNNPLFPTAEDGAITITYSFTYDNKNTDLSDFCWGRLTSVRNAREKSITKYKYDYLGRISSYTFMPKPSLMMEQALTYTFDCMGNIKEVNYPKNTLMQKFTLLYSYNDYAQVQKIELKKDPNALITVLNNAQYDLFDQLASYTQLNDFNIVRKWSIEGHLIYAGPVDSFNAPVKHYLGHWNPDALVSMDYTPSNKPKITKKLEYAASGALAKTYYTKDNVTHTRELEYDGSGNLTSLKSDQETMVLAYERDRLKKVTKAAGTLVSTLDYKDDGFLSNCTFGDESYALIRDDFYDNKVKRITNNSPSTRTNYLAYDHLGNLLSETYQKLLYKFYIYGSDNQLAYQSANTDSFGMNTIYIYCSDILVAQYHLKTEVVENLVYDDRNTLLCAKDTVLHEGNSLEMLFGDPAPALKGLNITFHYAGMYYMEHFDVHEDDGQIYFYQYGITSTPNLKERYHTPYRKFGNNPLQ